MSQLSESDWLRSQRASRDPFRRPAARIGPAFIKGTIPSTRPTRPERVVLKFPPVEFRWAIAVPRRGNRGKRYCRGDADVEKLGFLKQAIRISRSLVSGWVKKTERNEGEDGAHYRTTKEYRWRRTHSLSARSSTVRSGVSARPLPLLRVESINSWEKHFVFCAN